MTAKTSLSELFGRILTYPDSDARDRYIKLVGIDGQKDRLHKILSILIHPRSLEEWARKFHAKANGLPDLVKDRTPLAVLAGDVGCGKTVLAESIGDVLAREHKIDITLLPLSLSTRGQGRVGEMTQLLSAAFDYAVNEGLKLKDKGGHPRGAILLLIDEADAIAQSREASQMHHEDRAGVNAFIRGIDQVSAARIPAAVIMCTNRLLALDPAVKRRAAEILLFDRPDDKQRKLLLESFLCPLGFVDLHIQTLTRITGAHSGRKYGFTFSDIAQRLLPSIVLDAYPKGPVDPLRAIAVAEEIVPTPPFVQEDR
jgi:AAA+ superfamily predicted ATPase